MQQRHRPVSPAPSRTTLRAGGPAWPLFLALLVGCSPIPAPPPGDDPEPVFTAAAKAALAALAPPTLPAPPRDPTNSFADNPAAARLGQRLFFDPRFSGRLLEGDNDGLPGSLGKQGESGRVACAGCHLAAPGFLDTRTIGKQISLASGWVLRRTPSLLDVGQARLLMWDGRRDSLHSQVFGPIEASNEMNSSRLFAAQQAARFYQADYQALFGALPKVTDPARFPQLDAASTGCNKLSAASGPPVCHGRPGDGAEFDGLSKADQDAVTRVVVNLGKALGAYERLLSCGPGRFDQWVHGDAGALSRAEQRGALLFVGKAGCVACHSGPYFTDQQVHNVGLAPATVAVVFIDAGDRGAGLGFQTLLADPLNSRGPFSDGDDGRLPSPPGPAQEGAFRTPGLRCAPGRPSLMHTGQMASLAEAVEFFDRGGHRAGYPGQSELAPLALTARERADLTAFLGALDGPGAAAALLGSP